MAVSLLLNRDYTPLRILHTKREAWDLIEDDVVYAVQGEGSLCSIASPSRSFEIPLVLVLKRYRNVPRDVVAWSRTAVLRRDRYQCIYCGKGIDDLAYSGGTLLKEDFTIDHIVPRSRGGGNTWANTACACGPCNRRKADRTPAEAGMRLLWSPGKPKPRSTLVVGGVIPDEWRKYLQQ